MDSGGRNQCGESEKNGQQPQCQMSLVALNHETHDGRQARREDEGEERRGPGRQQRGRAQHHSAQDKEEKHLIGEIGWRVKQEAGGAPARSGQARAGSECGAPGGRSQVRLHVPIAAFQREPGHRYQHHVNAPTENDGVRNHTPLQAAQDRRSHQSDRDPDV